MSRDARIPAPMPPTSTPTLEVVVTTERAAARAVADEIADLIAAGRRRGRPAVLGLATGRSPLALYDELARRAAEGSLDLSDAITFNLDEYLGLPFGDARSFRERMRESLFERAGLREESTHVPRCDLRTAEALLHAETYEREIARAGGIDLQVLGIGRNGHVGFNEPGSGRETRTREVELARETLEDASGAFGGIERVPRRALTVGVATILDARRLRVLAFGRSKRDAVRRTLEDPIGPAFPATFLREHGDARLYVDADAFGGSR
jgi:glucosamine-6-phosphate deaminase